jgi:hypothetical protein
VRTTPAAARRLLHQSNPVPDDAFPGAAGAGDGPAVLAAILATTPVTAAGPRWLRWRAASLPGRRPIRAWTVAVPAVAMATALAGLLAFVLPAASGPAASVAAPRSDPGFARLLANLTAHPSAHPGDAATVLGQLAAAAARQPAVPLGPVEYSKTESWRIDLAGSLPYGPIFRLATVAIDQGWLAPGGSSLGVETVPGGKYEPGTIPVQQDKPSPAGQARFAWYDPATLPAGVAALRQHLIDVPFPPFWPPVGSMSACTMTGPTPAGFPPAASMVNQGNGKPTTLVNRGEEKASCMAAPGPFDGLSPDPDTQAIVSGAAALMSSEPLPPTVRAALLGVLADQAAPGRANARFLDLGTVTSPGGQAGVAIGYESPGSGPPGTHSQLLVLAFDPATGALLGQEYAYCTGAASSYPAAGSCTPSGYEQILQVSAVQAIPAAPSLAAATPPRTSASASPTP